MEKYEKIISGVLHYKYRGDEAWKPFTAQELSDKLQQVEKLLDADRSRLRGFGELVPSVFIRHSMRGAIVIQEENPQGDRRYTDVSNISDDEFDIDLILKNIGIKTIVDAEAFHIFPDFAVNVCHETNRVKLTWVSWGTVRIVADFTEKLSAEDMRFYCNLMAYRYPMWDGTLESQVNVFVKDNESCKEIVSHFRHWNDLPKDEKKKVKAWFKQYKNLL